MTSDPDNNKQGEGTRPEADGPDHEQPPAVPAKPDQPTSPEKSPDVHGAPEPPA